MQPSIRGTILATNVLLENRGKGIPATDIQNSIEYLKERTDSTSPTLDVISVKDFGAKGDGSTDDTEAIKDALQTATGKMVYFPKGSYVISETLSPGSNTTIFGEDRNLSVLVKDNSMSNPLIDASNLGVKLHGITLDGNRVNGATGIIVRTVNTAHVSIENCTIRNAGEEGVWGYRSASLTIRGCLFEECLIDIRIDNWIDDRSILIEGNNFYHSDSLASYHGVLIVGGGHIRIIGNHSEGVGLKPPDTVGPDGTWGHCFFIFGVEHLVMNGNTAYKPHWSPLVLGANIKDYTVTGNVFHSDYENKNASVWIEQAGNEYGIFSNNICNGGIMLGDSGGNYVSFTGNIIRTYSHGIDLSNNALDTIIANNIFLGIGDETTQGIHVWDKTSQDHGCIINGNIIRGFDQGIFINNSGGSGSVHGLVLTCNQINDCNIRIAKPSAVTLESDCVISNNTPNDTITAYPS